MTLDLSGKVVVVTGASSGIGAALALAFARAGAELGICARRPDPLHAVRDAAAALGRRCHAEALDLRRFESVRLFASHVLAVFGRVDVLVNNAGVLGPRAPLAEFPVEAWGPVLEANVNGVFHTVRAFVPSMLRAGRGSVVTVTSGVGRDAKPRWGAYGVSKFAVEGLGLGLAAEVAGTGVRSNLVNPGPTRTPMRAEAYPDEDPATLRTPEEILPVFLYLASDASAQVNGRRFDAWEFRA